MSQKWSARRIQNGSFPGTTSKLGRLTQKSMISLWWPLGSFLVVASGIFSSPKYIAPPHPNASIHSSQYREAQPFADKNVLVIGNSFSGLEISSALNKNSDVKPKSVTHCATGSVWILSRMIRGRIPVDFAFYKRNGKDVDYKTKNTNLSKISEQQDIEALKVDEKLFDKPPFVALADQYCQQVREGQIRVVKSAVTNITESNEVHFRDGSKESFDAIIQCTGYAANLDYMDEQVKQSIKYDAENLLLPVVLYKATLAPRIRNLGFVGFYRGPYFGVMELQARWCAQLFAGKVDYPSENDMQQGLKDEEKIRHISPPIQFPHGNYVAFADNIADEIGAVPSLDEWEKRDSAFHKILLEAPMIPAHYQLNEEANCENAKKEIERVSKIMKACVSPE